MRLVSCHFSQVITQDRRACFPRRQKTGSGKNSKTSPHRLVLQSECERASWRLVFVAFLIWISGQSCTIHLGQEEAAHHNDHNNEAMPISSIMFSLLMLFPMIPASIPSPPVFLPPFTTSHPLSFPDLLCWKRGLRICHHCNYLFHRATGDCALVLSLLTLGAQRACHKQYWLGHQHRRKRDSNELRNVTSI